MAAKPRRTSIERRSARSTILYRGFPAKLCPGVPDWVAPGALFHIRIAIDRKEQQAALPTPSIAESLLDSAKYYESEYRWYTTAFLLMPDHLRALLSFQRDESMSRAIGGWKHFQSHRHGMIWQEGYFDHRLRDDEPGEQLSVKINYIRQNPLVAGLCAKAGKGARWSRR